MHGPKWLLWLEKRAAWLAVPQIAILFITLQVLGFGALATEPLWAERLALLPAELLAGEYWRAITFLSLPVTQSPIWLFFFLWFQFFVFQQLENQWGAFRTTFYVLCSIVLTVTYSLVFDYPVLSVSHFASSLFLAAAMLFPEQEITLYFLVPVKMKWLAILSGLFVLWEAWRGSWLDRGHLVAIYSSFLIFFGPSGFKAWRASIQNAARRAKYKGKLR